MKDSAEVTLVKDGKDTQSILTLNAQNEWKASFNNLMKYDRKDGHAIQYTVKETPIKDCASNITGDVQNGFVITNTNVYRISIPVQKVWVGPALDSVKISLVRDGKEVVGTMTLSKESHWQSSFNDLPEYDPADGHKYVYSLQEMDVPNYKSVITGTQDTGFTITNTITGKVSVGVTKQWIGKGVDSVTVDLMSGDQKIDSVKLSEDNHWQHTFTDLDQYDENGREISYSVSEVPLDGYTSTITGDMTSGFIITNTNVSTRNIFVVKKWIGQEGSSATVVLKQDGQVLQTVVMTKESQWKYAFKDLPRYDERDGHEIEYVVEEKEQSGYTSTIRGNVNEGFVVTNTQIQNKTTDKADTPTKKGTDTSEKLGSMKYIVLAITSVLLLIIGLYYKRKQ